MILGCIADDFTGASDLGNTLTKQGMNVVQYNGIPNEPASTATQAGIVSLKSRSIAVEEAVSQSLAALEWLKAQGCQQFFFKYCSTFDSTMEGNIGPVAEALARELNEEQVIFCPAFPGVGRSVYQGHLFVNDSLLSDSSLKNHPLNPMTDSDLRRWLDHQVSGQVGHVGSLDVWQGARAIKERLALESAAGRKLIIIDAINDNDLMAIGKAAAARKLITGGSGVAMGLPGNFSAAGLIGDLEITWRGEAGACAVVCGSCSEASRQQIARHSLDNPVLPVDIEAIIAGRCMPDEACDWVVSQKSGIPLVYSSAVPEKVQKMQEKFGRAASAEVLESFFGSLAKKLVKSGITRLVTAGGETSGAVVESLGCGKLEIGPEIDLGIPALRVGPNLVLALKSGNFGGLDFFSKAARCLAGCN